MNNDSIYDLLIIGGGINGTAIALDAAGRGLKVILCEADDLASGTSSASTKLIHGGLRYLENGQLCFVRESLREREILLQKAPHIIKPMRFIMPYHPTMRPAWIIRMGLFLYDHLSGRKLLSKSQRIDLHQHPAGSILKSDFSTGFSYADCWADDARLVVLNAIAAQQHGANIRTRTKVINASRQNDNWLITVTNQIDGNTSEIRSRAIVNAAGPWVDYVSQQSLHINPPMQILQVKGSHIIVPRIGNHDEALVLQNNDRRILFVIPYLDQFSLIGTTDESFAGDPREVKITEHEIRYLCDAANRYLQTAIHPNDVLFSYAGVRALASDDNNLSAASRDYHLLVDDAHGKCPILTVIGGKITTHRQLAEAALLKLKPYFSSLKSPWTHDAILPGGDIVNADNSAFITDVLQRYSQFDTQLIIRYAHQYGTRIHNLLADIDDVSQLGTHFGASLYLHEVKYLIENEFALTSSDILWRRTKLGYFYSSKSLDKLNQTIKNMTLY